MPIPSGLRLPPLIRRLAVGDAHTRRAVDCALRIRVCASRMGKTTFSTAASHAAEDSWCNAEEDLEEALPFCAAAAPDGEEARGPKADHAEDGDDKHPHGDRRGWRRLRAGSDTRSSQRCTQDLAFRKTAKEARTIGGRGGGPGGAGDCGGSGGDTGGMGGPSPVQMRKPDISTEPSLFQCSGSDVSSSGPLRSDLAAVAP